MFSVLHEFTEVYTWVQIVIAFLVFLVSVIKPKWFWPLIIISIIFGQGPRFLRYSFLDELLVGCVVLGAVIRIILLRPKRTRAPLPTQQRAIYFIWISYMIIESVIGIMINDDLRIMRWVLFYVLLGLVPVITYNYDDTFPFPPLKRLLWVIVITTLVYDVSYIGVGIIYDNILGPDGHFSSQFLLSGLVWSGTAIAVFPTLIAVPAAIIMVVRNRSLMESILGWSIVLLSMIIGFYYDSRMTWVVVIGCFATMIIKFRIGTIGTAIIMFLIVLTLNVKGDEVKGSEKVSRFLSGIYEATQTLWDPKESDMCRNLQFKAAFLRLTDNPVTFFVGDGRYSHRFTMIPHIEKLYALYLPNIGQKVTATEVEVYDDHDDGMGSYSIFRTTGFTGLLIDTGMIGMILFATNFILVGAILFRQKTGYRMMLLFILYLSFWWLFVNDVTDVLILYFLMMPAGLLEKLGRSEVLERLNLSKN